MSNELNVAGNDPGDSSPYERSTDSNQLRTYHLSMLLAATVVLLAAFVLRVRSDQRIELGVLPDLPLPELCQSRALFAVSCPGCGLTRSFVFLSAGDLTASLTANRVGWLFAAVICLQLPYRLWAINSVDGHPLGRRIPWLFLWIPFALLLANWLANLAALLI